MKLSFVVPVYNVEKYLEICLKSLVAQQSLEPKDFEIILVDNGSTDNSLQIAEKYVKKYQNIKLFTQSEPGAAAARNLGLEKAAGKYIWFIDADDYIAKDAAVKLLELAERTQADLVNFTARKIHQDGSRSTLAALNPEAPDFKSRFVRYGFGPWHFMILRSWWVKNNFKFKEGIIHEDMEMMSSLILYTEHVAATPETLYFYVEHPGSVLHKEGWDEKSLDIFAALEGLMGRFKEKKAEKIYHDELEYFFIWNLLLDSARDFKKSPKGRVEFEKIRTMLTKYFPNWRKNKFFLQKSFALRLRCLLAYHGIVL